MNPIVVFNSSFTQFFDLDGVVLYPFVLISETRENTMPSTLKHELMHVKQVHREGFLGFYCKYAKYIANTLWETGDFQKAFIENEFEDEAYGIEMVSLNSDDLLLSGWDGARSDAEFKRNKAKQNKAKQSKTKQNKNKIKTK